MRVAILVFGVMALIAAPPVAAADEGTADPACVEVGLAGWGSVDPATCIKAAMDTVTLVTGDL